MINEAIQVKRKIEMKISDFSIIVFSDIPNLFRKGYRRLVPKKPSCNR